jgi:hypothetical protein
MRAITVSALLVLVPVLASAQQPCTSNADSAVDAIYRRVLERPAGGEGNARAEQLRNGQTTVRDLVREIAKSPEHRQRFLSTDGPSARVNAVSNLYRHLLGRAPDQAGLDSHVQGLERNDINTIIDTMIDSPEYQQQFGDDRVPGGTIRYCRDASDSAARRPQANERNNRDSGFNSFANLDTDRSGTVTPNEWRWTVRSFDRYDTDGDNLITRREFENAGGPPDNE